MFIYVQARVKKKKKIHYFLRVCVSPISSGKCTRVIFGASIQASLRGSKGGVSAAGLCEGREQFDECLYCKRELRGETHRRSRENTSGRVTVSFPLVLRCFFPSRLKPPSRLVISRCFLNFPPHFFFFPVTFYFPPCLQ